MFDEINRFLGVGQASVTFVDLNVLLDAAQHSQFGLDANSFGVRPIDNALRNRDVLFERLVAGVDHYRAVKAGIDAVIAGFLIAVIEMNGEDGFGEYFLGRAEHRFEHALVRIFSCALGELNDKRRFALHVAAEQTENLFHVINVIGADGEFAISDFVKLSGSNDHKMKMSILAWNRKLLMNLMMISENRNPKIRQFFFVLAGKTTLTDVP